MKLYTKRGDDGLTDLLGGGRVPKDSPRMEVIGQVDELNGALGWVVSADTDTELGEILTRVQSRLFEIGAELAAGQSSGSRSAQGAADESRFGPDEIDELERHIDAACGVRPLLAHSKVECDDSLSVAGIQCVANQRRHGPRRRIEEHRLR